MAPAARAYVAAATSWARAAPRASTASTYGRSLSSSARRRRTGPSRLAERGRHVVLEVAVALVARCDLDRRAPAGGGQQLEQVGQSRLGGAVVAHLPVGVGDRLAHLPCDLLVGVEQADGAERRVGGLRHLALGVLEVHDACPCAGDGGFGDSEGLAVTVVEPDCDLAAQLQVLALVVAHRDGRSVVEEDVGRHETRVGEEPDPDRLLPLALVLELGHAPELAHGGGALEQPGEPGVLGDVALNEEGAAVRIQPDGEQVERRIERVGPDVHRVDVRGQRMEVDDAVEGVVALLEGHPVPEGPEVVPQGEIAGGRDTGEDPVHGAPW